MGYIWAQLMDIEESKTTVKPQEMSARFGVSLGRSDVTVSRIFAINPTIYCSCNRVGDNSDVEFTNVDVAFGWWKGAGCGTRMLAA